jgi:hypothetical protein
MIVEPGIGVSAGLELGLLLSGKEICMNNVFAGISPPGIAILVVLALCSVALVGLVVTLPAVRSWLRPHAH